MNVRHELRRLALQTLYQLDALGGGDMAVIRRAIEQINDLVTDEPGDLKDIPVLDPEQLDEVANWVLAAWADHQQADALATELAPGWPPSRQPAIDRAILRLAYHEITSGITPPKVAINEAIEMAKQFSTERSPAFINGVLDKMYKRLRDVEPEQSESN